MPKAARGNPERHKPLPGIISLAIAELRPDPQNARIHTDKQIGQIARSIEAFGFNVPILIDRNGQVIAGHGRLLACQRLGWSEVPTIRLDHLSEAQVRAFMIADNKLTENADWDRVLLGAQFKLLSSLDLDFQLEDTGFEMAEIDLLISDLNDDPAEDPDDTLPPAGPPVTIEGDLWQLGPHRILCGNALSREAYEVLMQGKRAAMVFTDPPYNVKVDGHVSGLGAVKHREFAYASGEMSASQFTDFLSTACERLAQHSKDGSLHYICMDWRHVGELMAASNAAYGEFKNICVWVKHNAGMGSLYRSQHELVFIFKNGKASHRNNVQLGQHGRYRSNVWHYPGANGFAAQGENPLALHPTVKPVAMVADAMLDCTARGDIVLDAFLGSGTTILAAQKTGRIGYGLEIDPLYIDTTIRRWQAMTGQQARHVVSGRKFDDAAKETTLNKETCDAEASI